MPMPSRSEFLDKVSDVVRSRFPLVKLERKPDEFGLSINGCWISLENLYRSLVGHPELLETTVEQWMMEVLLLAEGSPDLRASFDQLKDRILPMLVPGGVGDAPGAAVVAQQLLDGLRIAYAIDSTRSIAYISKKAFEKWGISVDDLHATALKNLLERSETMHAQAEQDEAGRVRVIIMQKMDGYDASRILLPGLHDRLREHLGSPFVAAIPNRDILICFRNEPEIVRKISQHVARDFQTMPHQVSQRLFLITADGIADYAPTGV